MSGMYGRWDANNGGNEMTAKINEHVRSAVCFYVIHGDDCNGESRQFESFLRREYPNVAIDYIEHVSGLGAGASPRSFIVRKST